LTPGTTSEETAMPHIVVEYSAGLEAKLNIDEFIAAVHHAALQTGIFPLGGVRTRAYESKHYLIADGHPDNSFVHISLKVGHGRDLETRKRACEIVFAAACGQLTSLYERSPVGISLEMQEIDPILTFKKNNLHEYVAKRQKTASERSPD
jgi:5-carboxymethyl-2-hydroxymuconate isomerase